IKDDIITIKDDIAFTENSDHSRYYAQKVFYIDAQKNQSSMNMIKEAFPDISFTRIRTTLEFSRNRISAGSIVFLHRLPMEKKDMLGITMKFLIELKQRLQIKLILTINDLYYLEQFPIANTCPFLKHVDAIYYSSSELKFHFNQTCSVLLPPFSSNHKHLQLSQSQQVNIGIIRVLNKGVAPGSSKRSEETLNSVIHELTVFLGLTVKVHETKTTSADLIVQISQAISKNDLHAVLYLGEYDHTIVSIITALAERNQLPVLYDNKEKGWEKYFVMFNSKTVFPLYEKNDTYTPRQPNLVVLQVFLNAVKHSYQRLTLPVKPLIPFLHYQISPYANKDNLFLISSKILVSQKPFSYTDKRSIYTTEDRFNQTLETIESIRKYAPNSFIVLIDNSQLSKHMEKQLNEKVDIWIKSHKDKILTYYTNDYPYKGFAELSQLIYAYNTLVRYMKIEPTTFHSIHSDHTQIIPGFKAVFKITGRYTLRPSFNVTYYHTTPTMVFKRNEVLKDMKYYYTCFYKIEPTYFHEYFHLLKKLFLQKDFYINNNILNLEEEIPLLLNYNFTEPKELGIKQNIAVWKEINEI
ncbi:MAG: hypothetical protein K2P99_06385, partial [Burkholderiales bacterium]|nr:hypothetical protein [Burkholderiales bacterium]